MDELIRLTTALAERYEIQREIGKGGMATVYLARDVRHDRRVALKLLNPELGALLGVERFLSEIRVTANLQHPNLLPLFDSGEADGLLFYVMPYVEGESLRARLDREKQLPIDTALHIAIAVANALDYAHRHGVIHRDLKPENILMHEGEPLVADFGIALAVSNAGGARITQTGLSLGTPQYMSPEQATGDRAIDGRTDVYSLAAVTYEMLAGDPPHMGSTSQAIIARVLTEKPRSVRVSRPNVPEFVDAALERALEKLPADRFASAAGFSAALNGSTPAGTSNSVAPSSGAAKRHAGVPRVLPLATMAVAAGAIMTWLVMRGTGNPGDATRPRQFSIVLPDSMPLTVATDPYGTGLKSFDLAPDGRTLVYTSATPSGYRLVMVDLDDDVATLVRRGDGGRSPAFSPDGRSVAAVVGDSEVRAFSWGDGSTSQIASTYRPQTILWRASRMYFNGGCSSASVTGGDLRPDKGPACSSDWVMSEAAPIGTRTDSMLLHVQGAIKIVSASTGAVRDLTVPAPSGAGAETPLHGSAPHFVAPGYLIFIQGSTLFAAPFDARTLHVTGQPRAVLSKVRKEQSGLAQLSISNDGTLVWAEGGDGALSRFVWVTPSGRVMDTVSFVPPAEVGSYALSGNGKKIAYSAVAPDRTSTLMIADLDRRVVDAIAYPVRLDPMNWIQHDQVLSGIVVHPDRTTRGASVTMGTSRGVVDTTERLVATESVDGSMRCLEFMSFGVVKVPQPILLVHSGGARDTVMLDNNGSNCRFSPDGRFVSWNADDGSELFAASTERSGSRGRISIAHAGGEARWSADSRTIYYRGTGAWYSIAAPGSDLKPVGKPRLLFKGNYLQAFDSWDRAPDGRFLLLAGDAPEHANRLRVITNFGKYLTERMAQTP